MSTMLEVNGLVASADEKQILNGLNFTVKPGEVHAIMGPNGSGKSTFSGVLAGNPAFSVDAGSATFMGQDLLDLSVEERAQKGLFLAFQYPVEIPGVNNLYFMRMAYNTQLKAQGKDEVDTLTFMKMVHKHCETLSMDKGFLKRSVNEGFSGGEKKRNEMLQMLVMDPTLAILDETDSGLDIDALSVIAKAVNALRSEDRSFVLVTHYQRLLDHIQPDFVHVLANGQIVRSGGPELALELEEKGYAWLADAGVAAHE